MPRRQKSHSIVLPPLLRFFPSFSSSSFIRILSCCRFQCQHLGQTNCRGRFFVPCFHVFLSFVFSSETLLSAVLGGLSNNLPYKIKFIIKFITPSVSGYLYCISSVMSCPVGGKGGGASPGGVDFLFFFLFFGFLYLCPVAVYCRERRNETTTTKKKKNPLG